MARDENQPSGAGGKFRKAPFRRSTPYDRPPSAAAAAAALRNPRAENGGWISKLVDPAQRLISYSAHRFFNTVFNKRLAPPPPPPPPPSSSDANHEAGNIEQEEVRVDPPGVQNVTSDQNANPSTNPDGDGFTVLEQILEQKTFTRPEIDRLKALLHSRTVDVPHENQEERSKALVSYNRNEELSRAPLQDKRGIKSHVISTPVVSTRVLDEDVASPAELAKAYMGSRPSKVSPSMLGLRGQALFEDSQIKSSVPFPSKSPVMSVLPKTSGNGGPSENGFATPRSRGRSAIYSMARTPYSRVPTSSTYKGVASTADAYSGPSSSSSRSLWEQTQPSGSKQGTLKRRFSVLDNDIGSVGPIRRTRPKSSLLSSRGLSSPVSSSTVFMNGIRISSESAQNPQSSITKPLALGEPKHTMAKTLSENGDNTVPSTSFSTVPSKSSEAASKIFEHLDKFVSPKEKSPTKMSPSMLRGQALKSMENVDSSKYLENGYNNNNSDVSLNPLEVHATSQKEHKVKENGPSRNAVPCDGSTTLSVVESTTEKKDAVLNVKDEVFSASDTVSRPSEKKRPFKMSVYECLELDDDDFSNNGVASGSFSDGRLKVEKIAAVTPEKPPAISEVKPPPSSVAINQKADLGTFDGVHTIAARATDSIPKLVGSDKYKNNSDDEFLVTAPETAVLSTSSSAMSIFSNATPPFNNLASQKVSGSTAFSANTNSGNNVAATSAATNSSSNLQSSVSGQSSAEPIFKFGSTAASTVVTEVPVRSSLESLGDKKKDWGFGSPSSSLSFGGTSATGASTGSGILGSTTASTFLSTGSGSGPSAHTLLEPSFKFEASTASTASAPTNFSMGSSNDKSKQGEMLGIPSGTSFVSTSATSGSASPFGFSAAASTSTSTNQSLGSTLFNGGSGSGTSAQSAPVLFSPGTGSTSFSQSVPVQNSSSASSPVFTFAGNTAFSSGSSALGSSPSSEANPVSSSTAPSTGWQPATSTSSKFALPFNSTSLSPGFGFSASSASSVSGATDSTVSFGASLASAATNNSSHVSYGASTVSAPSSNSASLFGASSISVATTNPFGASTVSASSSNGSSMFGLSNGDSSAGIFQFGSSATNTTSSKPAFGNSSTLFPLAAAPSGNNDQMSMEDNSMAEDTVPAFSQQPVSTPQSGPTGPVFSQATSTPQSHFVFGGSPAFQFSSQPNLSNMQNPFQASAPQNPLLFQASNPQDPSQFQASSSLGTDGSFSLGSTGGDKSKRRIVRVKHRARKQ